MPPATPRPKFSPGPLPLLCVLALSGCGDRPGPWHPIARAAYDGDVAQLAILLTKPHAREELDEAVVAASRSGRGEALEMALGAGGAVDQPSGVNGWTPLMHAIHKHRANSVKLLLDHGAAAAQMNSHALTMAAGYGELEAVTLLLAHGADPRATDFEGMTPLAATLGGPWDIEWGFEGCEPRLEIAKLLVAARPGLKLPDGKLSTEVLETARKRGCDSLVALATNGAQ